MMKLRLIDNYYLAILYSMLQETWKNSSIRAN